MLNRTPDAIRRTRIIPTFQNILITVISAVVITITHPEWFHTDGCSLTASLVAWTRHISVLAHLNRLIRLICILTVIDSIAELMLGDTTRVGARVFIIRAGRVWAVNLVGSITTVVFVVTLPVLEDAAAVAAPKFRYMAGMVGTEIKLLVTTISTVIGSVTSPQS